jgi:hypothetical protein
MRRYEPPSDSMRSNDVCVGGCSLAVVKGLCDGMMWYGMKKRNKKLEG